MGVEFELKYRADMQTLSAIAQAYEGFREIAMETTYYDTPDLKFSMRRWTVRRRMENGTAVCTVKADLPDGSRGEWEVEANSIMVGIPKLCKLGAPMDVMYFAVNGLISVCGARFTRQAALVELEDATVELALDQGVLLGGGREIPLQEVEVELKEGSREAAVAFAQLLAARFGLTPEPKSKFVRAMALNQKG